MSEILMGIGCGCAVCVFGMWAFLHGVRAQMEAKCGNLPTLPRGPLRAASDAAGELRRGVAAGKRGAVLQNELADALRGFDPAFRPEKPL